MRDLDTPRRAAAAARLEPRIASTKSRRINSTSAFRRSIVSTLRRNPADLSISPATVETATRATFAASATVESSRATRNLPCQPVLNVID